MHTEHLTNVHPVRILAGWLVAVAVTAVVVFGFVALGLMEADPIRDAIWAVIAVAAGFLVGGWFTGVRTLEAPILHGIALGLTSLVAWAALNLLAVVLGMDDWSGLTVTATSVVLLIQILAAIVGTWFGTRIARGRLDGLADASSAGVGDRTGG